MKKLKRVYLNYNAIEVLHKNLFKNNLLLEVLWIGYNNLKIINVNFATLPNIGFLFLARNFCINLELGDYDLEKPEMKKIHENAVTIMEQCKSN